MTACVNKKSKRVAAVVTASLVGALSIGAPAVALAANANIDLQFAAGDEFAQGTLESIKVDGVKVTGKDANGVATVQLATDDVDAQNLPLTVSVEKIKPAGAAGFEKVDGINYRMRVYKADKDGNPTGSALSGDTIRSAGSYVVTVEALSGSDFAGQVYKQALNVKGAAFPSGLVAYENATSDKTFTYTGSELSVDHFVGEGVSLTEGVDYTVSFKKDGKNADLKDAGTYTATLTGLGSYSGSSASCKIEVAKFAITGDTKVSVAPFTDAAPSNPTSVINADGTQLDASLVGLTPVETISKPGKYFFKVSAQDTDNITVGPDQAAGKHTFGYKVENIASFNYGKAALADSYEMITADLDIFDVDNIKAYYGKTAIATKPTITVYNQDSANPAQDLADGKFGTYTVTVDIVDDVNFKYAGSKTVTVVVYDDVLDADKQLYVYENGSNVAITSYGKLYDGNGVSADNFRISAKGTSAKDYTKKIVDSEGKTVSEAVSAGDYKLVATSKKYKLTGTTEMPVTVKKVDLTTLKAANLVKWNEVSGQEYLPLDKAIILVNNSYNAIEALDLRADTGNAAVSGDPVADFAGFDRIADCADVVVEWNDNGTWKKVGKISAAGEYRAVVTVGEDIASNYVLPEGKDEVVLNFTVATKTYFSDVQPSDWFYNAVNKAAENKYMNGYGGTTTFGPNDALTRGQVAVVLFNMSGAVIPQDETNAHYNTESGWNTGFSDVDGKQYYGQAIYWAKKTGVVNGYADGSFRPDQTITREQFAGMLANYAKLVNRDETVGTVDVDEALKGFKDASSVSDWAEDAVAWAVSKDVMGNGGSINPAGTLTRAEAAAMSVNYQPNRK